MDQLTALFSDRSYPLASAFAAIAYHHRIGARTQNKLAAIIAAMLNLGKFTRIPNTNFADICSCRSAAYRTQLPHSAF